MGTIESTAGSSEDKSTVIVVEHLYKKFGDNVVLDDFNLKVFTQENVVVLGKSGSGKSVLVKCIVGLMKPDSGRVYVLGEDIATLKEDELDLLRTKLGFLFQSNALYDSMTVRENLEFPVRRHWEGMEQAEIDSKITEALENVGLEDTIDMLPSELSGGMAKRIALARAMILKPEIIFYDEPTAGLDPVTAREINALILKMKRKYHTSSIIITHDMECVKHTADRVLLLLEGKCYMEGTYKDLEQSTDKKIKQFFELES
ncbi:ABC transporter ATP-binding protein [Pedobacter nyackensis]|uniref:Phospholipid/cholesterol/gamma-HCH transport system ATP-binding protein n=1 Tax=Pedobacter nyackensis TaxID=475255 RepID=A0A1W2DC48_9SPHI|nr:ATP-binding cassette domain-containing protein [Pedobacter nyackensis]SMC94864.1 phospholipid/cholesterol/gamma-HCH transport system ATP-binding protein [Pedobacter nyackensis]